MKHLRLAPCYYFCFLVNLIHLLSPIRSWSSSGTAPNRFEFDRIEQSTLYYKPANSTSVESLKTHLFELNYLGTLQPSSPEANNYFLFSGKTCQDCLEDKGIFAINPAEQKPVGFVYPGKVFDPKNHALLLEARAFYGKCLHGHGDVYVVFQKERIDRRAHLQESVFVAEPGLGYLHENLIERHLPRLQATLQAVKKKTCHEIEGRNRVMQKKIVNIHPQADEKDDDDDAPETPPSAPKT